ncbi:MAG: hypothetical protein J7J87_00990 [Candidatus Diapherotrites archaeon]|uniref:Uncharacterized protein n=1 Tax=Candidatus Iainarchaeum sp. TaxID=3101447 RepID=A0A497JHF9_9ARCH|nr:hypothetical protein [Candidatus Diapherotrites archaeon]RLG70090.1 MAG: hypothetical protein DRO07_01030 [Candidatus Diapherotrites archaeon]
MDKRAFVLSLDATLCLVIVAVVIIATLISIANIKLNQHELLILQKEHDLLKHWVKTRASEDEMIEQANALLANENFTIEINDKKVFSSGDTASNKAISSTAFIFDEELNVKRMKLTVFK